MDAPPEESHSNQAILALAIGFFVGLTTFGPQPRWGNSPGWFVWFWVATLGMAGLGGRALAESLRRYRIDRGGIRTGVLAVFLTLWALLNLQRAF